MKYQIQSDNMELTPSMSELAKSKLEKLSKHFQTAGDSSYVRVVMNSAPVDSFEVKINIEINGKTFFGDDTNYSLESALINAVDELGRQLDKSKDLEESEWKDKREAKRSLDVLEELE